MPIYDCVIFFNETELLKARISYLYDHVDKFIICESPYTFSGQPKPLNFEKYHHLFRNYLEKVDYLIYQPDESLIDFKAETPLHYDPNHWCWNIERGQRDFILRNLINYPKQGISFICDLDEIWDVRKLQEIKNIMASERIARLEMAFHYFFVNVRGVGSKNKSWNRPYVINNTELELGSRLSLSEIRESKRVMPTIRSCGWHFSYLGGQERISEKLKSFSHQEKSIQIFNQAEHINLCLSSDGDLFARPGHQWEAAEINDLDENLLKILKTYPHMWRR